MNPENCVTLHVEIAAGASIQQAARDMHRLAFYTKCTIESKFSGVTVLMWLGRTKEQFVEAYFAALKQEVEDSKRKKS